MFIDYISVAIIWTTVNICIFVSGAFNIPYSSLDTDSHLIVLQGSRT